MLARQCIYMHWPLELKAPRLLWQASNPLFRKNPLDDPQAFGRRPTFKAFYNLLDNYVREVGVKEVTTSQERLEQSRFLDLVLKTPVMQYVHKYLAAKRLAPANVGGFKSTLQTLWFRMYKSRKGGPLDSSGFEHVFVGEEDEAKGEVTGMHNWIQIADEERKGNLDYRGFFEPRRSHKHLDSRHILTLQFSWQDPKDGSVSIKPLSTR